MPNDQTPNPSWLRNPPLKGQEAQRLKEHSQNNRREKFRSRKQRG
jgi:hypothetical protein